MFYKFFNTKLYDYGLWYISFQPIMLNNHIRYNYNYNNILYKLYCIINKKLKIKICKIYYIIHLQYKFKLFEK